MFGMVFSRLVWIVFLMVAQVFVFNRFYLWEDVTPLPYVYILVMLSRDVPRAVVILIGFAVGLLMDIFASTPGIAAITATLLALLQPVVLQWFTPKDAPEDFAPSFRSMNTSSYLFYVFLLVLGYRVVFTVLDFFVLSSWKDLLIRIGVGTVSTYLCVLAFDMLRTTRSHGE